MQMQSSTQTQREEYAGRAFGMSIGNLFMAFFGLAWIVVGLAVGGKAPWWGYVAAVVFAAAIAGYSIQTIRRTRNLAPPRDAAAKKKYRRSFAIVNAVQWGSVFVGIAILDMLQLYVWILPLIILIVGIHFFPLARLFENRSHYFTGSALVAWAIVYPILFTAGKGDWIGGTGTGVILWTGALWMAGRIFRLRGELAAGVEYA